MDQKITTEDVNGTRGINTNDKFCQGESENDFSTAGSTNSVECLDWKPTMVFILQDYFIVSPSSSYSVNVCMDTILNNYNDLRIKFVLL